MPGRDLKVQCQFCQARVQGFFCNLDRCQVDQLDEAKTFQHFTRGQTIYYEGSPPLAVYCIHSGTVKLYKTGDQGEPYVTHLLRAGDMIGYASMLAEEPHAATAEALEDTAVCVIPRGSLLSLLEESKPLAIQIMTRLARELRGSQDQIVAVAQLPVRQRLAQLLLYLNEDEAERKRPPVQLLRREMAQMIGTTPETLSRELRHLVDSSLIETSRAEIRVRNRKKLRKIARTGKA
jgi:CRP/FNR family transcriptional regulator